MRATAATVAWRLAIAGLAVVAAGFAAILVASVQGMQLQEGLSLVDGYWVGLLPWIEVGTWLVPIGAVVALVAAVAAIWLGRGGWLLRIATLPAIAVAVLWVIRQTRSSSCCFRPRSWRHSGGPSRGADPVPVADG
jgi:hypothetical protein